jgi:hypothetical protein
MACGSAVWFGRVDVAQSLFIRSCGVPAVAAEILESAERGLRVSRASSFGVQLHTRCRTRLDIMKSGGYGSGMAFIDGFTTRDLRLTGVSPTLSRVTAGLAAERWRADHVV